jgi:uncharacterized protein YigA (DUF484 family)
MKNKFQSIEDAMEISRANKKLNANYQRVRQALSDLVEATATAQTLTDSQKRALDKSIVALQYKV